MTGATAAALYEQLLASIGAAAPDAARVVVHWPHVGSAYDGVVILGQAVNGWPDDFEARSFTDPSSRLDALKVIRERNAGPSEPMDWLGTHRVRTSPFWTVARLVVEALTQETGAPWFARFAWLNLYPVAPEIGNPGGWLREAQDPYVGPLVDAHISAIHARIVVALVGPYWWPTGDDVRFASLERRGRPLALSGLVDGRQWIVGWHPAGASRRHFAPSAYASSLIGEAERLRAIAADARLGRRRTAIAHEA